MPHLAGLLHGRLEDAVGARGLVLAAQRVVPVPQLAGVLTPEHTVLDINGWPELRGTRARYEGFCW